MFQEVTMKNRKIISIYGIVAILSLVFAILPVLPVYATINSYSITLTPNQGEIGASISFHGICTPTPTVFMEANIYFSPNNLAIGAALTSASTYMRVVPPPTILSHEDGGDGNFSTTFTVPSSIPSDNNTLIAGTVAQSVSAGSYYIYVTVTTSNGTGGVVAKANFTVTQPTLAPLSPNNGPPGTSVAVSGNYFPENVPLAFKFETTTLTPTNGDTSTEEDGSFFSYITIPSGYLLGPHTIYITAGTGSSAVPVSVTFTITGSTTAAIDSITPQSGIAGSLVEVIGSGFPPSTPLTFHFDDGYIPITELDTETSTAGSFISRITIPLTASPDYYTIEVSAGSISAFAYFLVTGTQPTTPPTVLNTPIIIDPTSGSVNTSVSVTGSSFLPNHTVTISFNGTQVIQTTSDETGHFLTSFQVPSKPSGNNTITATDGINMGAKTFLLESISPPMPPPQRPLMGEAASSPVTFDWDDVTDNSTPVTYRLQIATSANFTADSLILDKTGILASQYTLNDDEMKKLSTDVPTYYWREKAVDAAYNESGWTGANEFSVAKPFSFTGWPLYVTIVLGALLFFLVGIWVGRRTAFSY
jgi:hypothetical protein